MPVTKLALKDCRDALAGLIESAERQDSANAWALRALAAGDGLRAANAALAADRERLRTELATLRAQRTTLEARLAEADRFICAVLEIAGTDQTSALGTLSGHKAWYQLHGQEPNEGNVIQFPQQH